MEEAIIGAIVGAFLGSVLGYLFSYQLARRQRADELKERRTRLLKTLMHELALLPPTRELPAFEDGAGTIFTGVYVASLDPLLDLAADTDEGLLDGLVSLKAYVHDLNDLITTSNHVLSEMDVPSVHRQRAHDGILRQWEAMTKAVDRLKPYLEIRG